MPVLLDRILYGPSASGAPAFGVSEGLTVQEALLWRGLASLDPLDGDAACGLFSGPADQSAFVRASQGPDGGPVWVFLVAPRTLLNALAGDVGPLLELAESTPAQPPIPPQIAGAELAEVTPWPLPDRLQAVESFLEARGGAAADLWSLLGMALHERGLMIYGAPANGAHRLRLVQAVAALLPAGARPLLTFTTNRSAEMPSNARIAFAERGVTTGRWAADWGAADPLPTGAQAVAYVQLLQSQWSGDVGALLDAVDAMEAIAARFADGRPLSALLAATADRFNLDRRVGRGDSVPPEALRQALRDLQPRGALRQQYHLRLLDHALEARDAENALVVARAMDADPELDAVLGAQLARSVEQQPDAAYAFIRVRVASGGEANPLWLERLAGAASAALTVAIADGDADIVRNWIRLLAREPLNYGLAPVLSRGLAAALVLGRTNPELARSMLIVCAKRDSAMLDTLLADAAFDAGLPAGLRDLLCACQSESLADASAWGVELLLAGMARAAAAHQPGLFTPDAVDTLWALAFGSQAVQVAEPFSAQRTLALLTSDSSWLPADTVAALLTAALRARRDDLFQTAIHALSAAPCWIERGEGWLSESLIASGRSAAEGVALLGALVSAGMVNEQAALNVSVEVIDNREWVVATLPLAAQAARAAQRGLDIAPDVVWQLLEIARAARDEAVARDAARRVMANLEAEIDDGAFAAALGRLSTAVRWNSPLGAAVLAWWRTFARTLPTARLTRLDRAFEETGDLDHARSVVASLLAFRRMLGKRTLEQFAQDAATALALLQSLDEAFDSPAHRDEGFDAEMMRAELEAQQGTLPPAGVRLLANQLAALAQLIGELGDNRTKQALLRRDDADQLLAHGEADPHGAVDSLKWLSGFLGGAHRSAEEPPAR